MRLTLRASLQRCSAQSAALASTDCHWGFGSAGRVTRPAALEPLRLHLDTAAVRRLAPFTVIVRRYVSASAIQCRPTPQAPVRHLRGRAPRVHGRSCDGVDLFGVGARARDADWDQCVHDRRHAAAARRESRHLGPARSLDLNQPDDVRSHPLRVSHSLGPHHRARPTEAAMRVDLSQASAAAQCLCFLDSHATACAQACTAHTGPLELEELENWHWKHDSVLCLPVIPT